MPEIISKKKLLIFGAVLVLILISTVSQKNNLKQLYTDFVNTFGFGSRQVVTRVKPRFIYRIVGPPAKKVISAEIDIGAGRRKLVVFREGTTKEYILNTKIWREYADIGGVESVLGSPTTNAYSWYDGKRQDFERGHWLYWNEQTGVQMDYNPYPGRDTNPQEPLHYPGTPMAEPAAWPQEKYSTGPQLVLRTK